MEVFEGVMGFGSGKKLPWPCRATIAVLILSICSVQLFPWSHMSQISHEIFPPFTYRICEEMTETTRNSK